MKKHSSFISVIALVIIAVGVFIYLNPSLVKSDRELIESRIEKFADAYNDGDLDKALDCMDSKTKNTYKSAVNITNSLIGKTGFGADIRDLFGLSVGSLSDGDMLDIDITGVEFADSGRANVKADLTFRAKTLNRNETEDGITIVMVKENGDWFINDMN
jgi:hypothetical protein